MSSSNSTKVITFDEEDHGYFMHNKYPATIKTAEGNWKDSDTYYDYRLESYLKLNGINLSCWHPKRRHIEYAIMEQALKEKFTQHTELLEKLLATEGSVIQFETHDDDYWGLVGGVRGNNALGELLRNIRDEFLRKTNSKKRPLEKSLEDLSVLLKKMSQKLRKINASTLSCEKCDKLFPNVNDVLDLNGWKLLCPACVKKYGYH